MNTKQSIHRRKFMGCAVSAAALAAAWSLRPGWLTETVGGSADKADSTDPRNRVTAVTREDAYGTWGTKALTARASSSAGGGQPHNNLQPFLAVNYIIALTGLLPSRG